MEAPNGMDLIDRHSTTAGKTLSEIVTVSAILGILAAMAAPSYQGLHMRLQGKTAVAEVGSTLRMARQLAMARRERLLVRFDTSAKTITLSQADAGGVLDVYHYADKGIVIDEPTAGSDLFFHASGRSASATTIQIYDRGHRRMIITVSLTGRVVIS